MYIYDWLDPHRRENLSFFLTCVRSPIFPPLSCLQPQLPGATSGCLPLLVCRSRTPTLKHKKQEQRIQEAPSSPQVPQLPLRADAPREGCHSSGTLLCMWACARKFPNSVCGGRAVLLLLLGSDHPFLAYACSQMKAGFSETDFCIVG